MKYMKYKQAQIYIKKPMDSPSWWNSKTSLLESPSPCLPPFSETELERLPMLAIILY